MRAALTQHDPTPPAAWTLNHERPPHKPHEQPESVEQQLSSEHTPPASPLPVKTQEEEQENSELLQNANVTSCVGATELSLAHYHSRSPQLRPLTTSLYH